MAFIPCLCPWEIELDSRLDVARNIIHLLFTVDMELIIAMHMGRLVLLLFVLVLLPYGLLFTLSAFRAYRRASNS